MAPAVASGQLRSTRRASDGVRSLVDGILDRILRRAPEADADAAASSAIKPKQGPRGVRQRRRQDQQSQQRQEQQEPRAPEAASSSTSEENPFLIPNQPPTPVLLLAPRQQTSAIPAYYGALDSSPDPGAVAGITLGSVAGFILILWLVYSCINMGNPPSSAESTVGTASVVVERKRRRRSHHHSSDSGSGTETVEIRRTTETSRVARDGPHVATGAIIVEEDTRSRSRSPERIVVEGVVRGSREHRHSRRHSHRHSRHHSHDDGPRVVEVEPPAEGSVDEVVVIEEHSPPRRARRRSTSAVRMRSVERRSSGYRDVYPDQFAGGDEPIRHVRRSSSRRD